MPMIPELWDELEVHRLTTEHLICLLGQELRVVHICPSDRGGDFFQLEAVGLRHHDRPSGHNCGIDCLRVAGAITLEIDKNRKIWARER